MGTLPQPFTLTGNIGGNYCVSPRCLSEESPNPPTTTPGTNPAPLSTVHVSHTSCATQDRRLYPRLCRRSLHLDNQSHRPGRLLRCPHARRPCPAGPRATHEHRQERRQRDAINRKEPQSKHNTKSRGGQPEKGNVCTLLKDTEILERCIWDRRTGVWVTRGSQQGGK